MTRSEVLVEVHRLPTFRKILSEDSLSITVLLDAATIDGRQRSCEMTVVHMNDIMPVSCYCSYS